MAPLKFTAEKTGSVTLYRGKASANAPFCDSSHAKLWSAEPEDPEPVVNVTSAVPMAEEPTGARMHEVAHHGLTNLGHHGKMGSMGVPRKGLLFWDDIQIRPAQRTRKPLLDHADVATSVTIGPRASKPLEVDIPLCVSEMSFGALSEEARIALARAAELAHTDICSGESGMPAEEQAENSQHLYELASAQFSWNPALVETVQAFNFKGGQGAKTEAGRHFFEEKIAGEIAEVRCLTPGQDAISLANFVDLQTPSDFRKLGNAGRERSGGIPVVFKLSADHIDHDIDFALEAGADYIILDGRDGGTGVPPLIFRNYIFVPTIPALARARKRPDAKTGREVSLVITVGLQLAEGFVKAKALGADAIAFSNSAMQAVGYIAARMCNSNKCPVGVATQKPELRKHVNVPARAKPLTRYFGASVALIQVLARTCGRNALNQFTPSDITTWHREIADLRIISFAGLNRDR